VEKPSRTNGLDTLRAIAIALVFMYHYRVFVSDEPTFGFASVLGWVGVDLFFVLSGYLIANQVFSGVARGHQLSPKLFYIRRGLRTLPAFWFVLALYFLFPAVMGGQPPPPLWRFLTFTQNLGLHGGTAFSHAWSLCIEEQFYLVLPLLVVAGAGMATFASRAWVLLAMAFALLVLAALSPGSWLNRLRVPGAYHLALWSYSIYLSHKAIAHVLHTQLVRWVLPPGIEPVVITLACLPGGWFLYRLIEKPFMACRDRLFPGSFTTPVARQAEAGVNGS